MLFLNLIKSGSPIITSSFPVTEAVLEKTEFLWCEALGGRGGPGGAMCGCSDPKRLLADCKVAPPAAAEW